MPDLNTIHAWFVYFLWGAGQTRFKRHQYPRYVDSVKGLKSPHQSPYAFEDSGTALKPHALSRTQSP